MFTEPLPSNNRGIHLLQGFMKYAVEMGSSATVYIPSFIKVGLGIKIDWGDAQIHKTLKEHRNVIRKLSMLHHTYSTRTLSSPKCTA
jgi:hypothetical protein